MDTRTEHPTLGFLPDELLAHLDAPVDRMTAALLKRAFDRVPAIALPGSGLGGRADTNADVVASILSLGSMLSKYMQENEKLRDTIRQHNLDLVAVRRVLGTLGQAEHEERQP